MRMKRLLPLVAFLLVFASNAFAVDTKRVISYYGFYTNGGTETICSCLCGPPIPPEVIGQKIRECDGYTWSWGNTTCDYYAPVTEYEDCPLSASTNESQSLDADAECSAATESEAK